MLCELLLLADQRP